MASSPSRRFAAPLALGVALLAALAADPVAARAADKKGKAKPKPEAKAETPAAPEKPAAIPADIVERVKPSVAYVVGKHGTGTGFFARPNIVVTNSHVVCGEMIDDVKLRFISNAAEVQVELKARLLFEDKERDLALLWVDRELTDRPPLELVRGFVPGPDKAVFVVGNPGQADKYTRTSVTRINAVGLGVADGVITWKEIEYVQIRVPVRADRIDVGHGNSGGPTFDAAGRVVGVLTGAAFDKNERPAGMYYCVPAAAVRGVLDGLGGPDGWAGRAATATARHDLANAAVNLMVTARLAGRCLDDRKVVAEKFTGRNHGPVLQADAQVIDEFTSSDKELAKLVKPSLRAAIDKGDLSAARRKDLDDLRATAQRLRDCAHAQTFSRGDYKHCRDMVGQCEPIFERLKGATGLTDRVAAEMQANLCRLVGIKPGR